MISMARPFLADPHLVKARLSRLRTSTRIGYSKLVSTMCSNRGLVLGQSTCMSRDPRHAPEARRRTNVAGTRWLLGSTLSGKRIAVLGGESCGDDAAVERAGMAQMVLFEAKDALGGQFLPIPGKTEFGKTIRFCHPNGTPRNRGRLEQPNTAALDGFDEVCRHRCEPRALFLHRTAVGGGYVDVLGRVMVGARPLSEQEGLALMWPIS